MKIIQKTLPPPRPLRLCGQLFPYHIPRMSAPLSRQNLPENPSPDEILNVFLDYLTATGTEPYDHQEEAILELFAGNNVILNTPDWLREIAGRARPPVQVPLPGLPFAYLLGSLLTDHLALLPLRDGAHAPVDDVIMDELHYDSDHSRGAAWQIPLLTLPRTRFLLMSATVGESSSLKTEP